MKCWYLGLLLVGCGAVQEVGHDAYCAIGTCMTLKEALKDQKDFNQKSAEDALIAEGLTLVEVTPFDISPQPFKPPVNLDNKYCIGGGMPESGPMKPPPEFVKDKDGKIYHLKRNPRVIQTLNYSENSCAQSWGAFHQDPIICFDNVVGEKIVTYDVKEVSIAYTREGCDLAP